MPGKIRIKVCGMKEQENIRKIAEMKPDFMGFIFYPGSARYVGRQFMIPPMAGIRKVGVFVNEKPETVIRIASAHALDFVQLHGSEPFSECEMISARVPVIKAFGVDDSFDFRLTKEYEHCCRFFLFDTKSNQHGGTGQRFDWGLLSRYSSSVPFFISGGLDEAALEEIASMDLPGLYAFDLNSRFELSPGIKDHTRLKKILAA